MGVEALEHGLGVLATGAERIAELRGRAPARARRELGGDAPQSRQLLRREVDLTRAFRLTGLRERSERSLHFLDVQPQRVGDVLWSSGLGAIAAKDRKDDEGSPVELCS